MEVAVNIIPAGYKMIAERVKAVVKTIDPLSTTILFGSRARGDASDESDWDFLVLSNNLDIEALAAEMRREIRIEVEMVYDIAVSLIVKNERVWKDDYSVTNIYESISEEGVVL